jgi:acetyl esterase
LTSIWRILRMSVLTPAVTAVGTYTAVRLSPWPSVLIIRAIFDSDATRAMAAPEPLIPTPADGWPVVVWVHGGAWVSGSPDNVANDLRLIAGRGVGFLAAELDR